MEDVAVIRISVYDLDSNRTPLVSPDAPPPALLNSSCVFVLLPGPVRKLSCCADTTEKSMTAWNREKMQQRMSGWINCVQWKWAWNAERTDRSGTRQRRRITQKYESQTQNGMKKVPRENTQRYPGDLRDNIKEIRSCWTERGRVPFASDTADCSLGCWAPQSWLTAHILSCLREEDRSLGPVEGSSSREEVHSITVISRRRCVFVHLWAGSRKTNRKLL